MSSKVSSLPNLLSFSPCLYRISKSIQEFLLSTSSVGSFFSIAIAQVSLLETWIFTTAPASSHILVLNANSCCLSDEYSSVDLSSLEYSPIPFSWYRKHGFRSLSYVHPCSRHVWAAMGTARWAIHIGLQWGPHEPVGKGFPERAQ